MKGYKTSKDYKRLKELLDKGYEVICIADYNKRDGIVVRDICRAKKFRSAYLVLARGIEYCSFWEGMYMYATFEEMCEDSHIEFIEPTEE